MGRLEVLTASDRLPRSACRYQRLRGGELGGDDCTPSPVPGGSVRARRPLRLRRRACKAAGRWRATTTTGAGGGGKRLLRLRLRLVRLVLLLPARRVAALVAELVRRLAAALVAAEAAADCPAIVFSSQWGLPVLSHSASTTSSSSRNSRLRAFYLDRSLSAGSSSGTGSPC